MTEQQAAEKNASEKKAYVVTHHWVPNFGANLQALGTSRALQRRGYTPVFVDFRPQELIDKYATSVPAAQHAAHDAFVERELTLTPLVKNQAEFETLCREQPADLFVSGSDAVLRVNPKSKRADLVFPNPYWLTNVDQTGNSPRRIMLAPSAMGTTFSRMSTADQEGMRKAVASMDGVCARDSWTKKQLDSLNSGREVQIVPDPVFSLRQEILDAAATRDDEAPYIVVSTQKRMKPEWIKRFTELAEAAGYRTLALPIPEGAIDTGTTEAMTDPIDPMDWLRIIARASGYLGVRFHPAVVSLNAGNPVVAVDFYHRTPLTRRRSKTWLLMREFGCETACWSRMLHRYLTPERAWQQMEAQFGQGEAKRAVAARLAQTIETYIDASLAAETAAAAE